MQNEVRAIKDNRDAIDFANEPVGHIFRQLLVPTVIGMLSIVIIVCFWNKK